MKHIYCVDNIDTLRGQVRQDLRELGIKVPKPKKSKRAAVKSLQEVNKSSIFGNYLATVHCVHIPDCGYVAKFLVDAAEIIKANIDEEGLFRKSGAVSRQKELRQQLDNGKGLVDANVHDVTALVKQFFRELPEPLFTSTFHDTFIRCYQMEDQQLSQRAILLLCLLLPGEHISMLRFTMKLFASIAEHCANNKMDTTNLSVILAPNIMRVKNSNSETMKSCEEKLLQVQTSVVEMLIKNADDVGMVNDDLVERTALMSEVFSTDDELDASEDNLEETHEKKRKEKKRKRSGSFQGFVSSIAQSITKWRRSTDGKTNTSAVSQTSYNSQVNSSHTNNGEKCEGNKKPGYQYMTTDATPVMRRKKTVPGTEGRAFSASKKKAILNQLPQHTALASTPYTPATAVKRMDINSARRYPGETPSIPPRPYQCTPRHSMKTPRKKVALFSPASTTKKKRYSSTTNLSMQSASKKTTKSKGIFRRLSGSKGDQAFPVAIQKTESSQQVGQRLASPAHSNMSTNNSICSKTSHNHISDESPVTAIAHASSLSSSLCEQSVLSAYADDRHSLNDGFIAGMEEMEGDITRIMSEPVICGSYEQGEYVKLGDICPRETLSDTMISCTPNRHSRSLSLDGTLDGSTRKSSLRRGQPNSLRAGLLQGDEKEVQKLRRSFGLDKSDISLPIPLKSQHMIDEGQYVHLDESFNDYLDSNCNEPSYVSLPDCQDVDMKDGHTEANDKRDETSADKPENLQSLDNDEEETKDDESNDILNKNVTLDMDISDSEPTEVKKTLAQQKQESKDSLLSETSSVISPVTYIKEREMTRSISADSGKGSLCDEPMEEGSQDDNKGTETTVTSTEQVVEDKLNNLEVKHDKEVSVVDTSVSMLDDSTVREASSFMRYVPDRQKSISTQDLVKEVQTPTPTRVSRSKSLLEGSFRKNNIKPNLQISAETHKLLARAGYISEQKSEKPNEDFDDFAVPGNLMFPVIKQAETINPRRESIIALQKNNAGHVKNNILQFNKISEIKKIDDKFVSPLRFPNSTTRRKGMSPLRLGKQNIDRKDSESDYIKEALNASLLDTSIGTARLPISTQLIKPSDTAALHPTAENEKGSSLKRKPSIYYAEKEMNRLRGVRSGTLMTDSPNCTIMEEDENRSSSSSEVQNSETLSDVNALSSTSVPDVDDNVFISDNDDKKRLFDGKSIELNKSLQETIISVCTPRSEKLKQNSEKGDSVDKENAEESAKRKMPEIKPAILTTPLTLDKKTLRTASNKTPLEVFKTTKSPRSPIKPLKRLGSSPHSPRARTMHSPKLVKNRRSLLSSMPIQSEELNNL